MIFVGAVRRAGALGVKDGSASHDESGFIRLVLRSFDFPHHAIAIQADVADAVLAKIGLATFPGEFFELSFDLTIKKHSYLIPLRAVFALGGLDLVGSRGPIGPPANPGRTIP